MSSQALLVTFIYEIVVVDVVVVLLVVVELLVVVSISVDVDVDVEEVVVGKSMQLHKTCKYLFTPGQGSP